MRKTKSIELSVEQRAKLDQFISSGKALARHIKHANVLLKLNQGWATSQIAQAFDLSPKTVIALRHRFENEGLEALLKDKPRSGKPRTFHGDLHSQVIATMCSAAPDGHARWTLRLLAARVVELELVESISPESIRQILKKTN